MPLKAETLVNTGHKEMPQYDPFFIVLLVEIDIAYLHTEIWWICIKQKVASMLFLNKLIPVADALFAVIVEKKEDFCALCA